MTFFEPSAAYAAWLVDFAAERPIIDVGSGDGDLLCKLKAAGQRKLCGIEPSLCEERRRFYQENDLVVLERFAEDLGSLLGHPGQVIVFARPCHGGFVEAALPLISDESDVLYVGLPKNLRLDIPRGFATTKIETPLCREEHTWLIASRSTSRSAASKGSSPKSSTRRRSRAGS